jgi:DNA-binding transcriptional LysR family regulator
VTLPVTIDAMVWAPTASVDPSVSPRRTVEIYHLRCFLAVAEHRSFTRAAQELALEPSPLSRRIRDLERHLRAPLFNRTSRRVWLTAAGHELLPLAEDVVGRFDAIRPHLQAGTRTSLSLGYQRSTPDHLVRRVLAMLNEVAPSLDVVPRIGRYTELAEAVLHEELDFTLQFVLDEPEDGELGYLPVEHYRFALAVAEADAAEFGPVVELGRLQDRTVLLTTFGDAVIERLRTIFRDAGVHNVQLLPDTLELALDVEAGRAVALAVEGEHTTFTEMLKAYRIAVIPMTGLDAAPLTGLVWSRRRESRDQGLLQVTQLLRERAVTPS